MIPATDAPAVIASITTAGCICTVRLWIIGWSTCPSRTCTASTTPSAHSAIARPRSASATSTAMAPDRNAPRYGMYAPTKTSAPSPAAPGTRRISSPTVMHTASMSAMNVVPRMKPSTAVKARRAIASTVSADDAGTSERSAPAVLCESRRKKNTSSSASTAVAIISPTTLIPLTTPDAAVPPNLPSRSLELDARSSSEVPAAPKCFDRSPAAFFRDEMIWSPVSMRAATTMYVAPPTTASTAAQVSPAARERCTRIFTSRRYSGPSSAVPSSASSTGVTAVFSTVHSHTPTPATPATSRTTRHQAATRRTTSGRRVCTLPPEHGGTAYACGA
ncbi:putative UPF0118 membrane protein YubA [Streptomyces aurantiacus JA 4570]|uniref:Putative UPF0118 membrane protein YubA n=1 Tax=Streptomyces aurantiacus JA 4570 TaxID=1286094 RepID=S4AD02_9ACTN|nr:putative UPF0118 membrane protein YubA [Streptomyces aurantiacus JA 4570]